MKAAVFDALPQPSARRIALRVSAAAERALRGGHPWLFDQAVIRQSHEGQPGDLAVIFDHKGRFLAVGLYDPESPIRVKVLQHRQQAAIDGDWFEGRLRAAAHARQPLLAQHTDGYRLVYGENDNLPGLVIDRYAGALVIKLYTAAWLPHLRDVIPALQRVQPFDHLVLRISRNVQASAALYGLNDGMLLLGSDLPLPVIFQENGLRFAADVMRGHKTGFFFDQRDNRSRVRELARGRRVLDVFAYSGGFSVYAAAGGALSVTSLDASAPALQAAVDNFALNQDNAQVAAAQHHTLVSDAFDGLEALHAQRQRFDMVIVDPPAFAKSEAEVGRALAAYARLTRLALRVLEPGGVFVMASCSSRVAPQVFFQTVTQSAQDSGHALRDIVRTGHALDHPITFPEGEYLKCLFATLI
jgi:23S rRNA (cytosine1962-C5)-methyltransferase